MSDPQEDEGDMPDDTDPSRSGVSEGNRHGEGGAVVADGDGDGETYENEEEDSSDDFFYAGEGAIIPGRLSLRATSESGGSGTKHNPVDPVTTGAGGPTTRSAARTSTPPCYPREEREMYGLTLFACKNSVELGGRPTGLVSPGVYRG